MGKDTVDPDRRRSLEIIGAALGAGAVGAGAVGGGAMAQTPAATAGAGGLAILANFLQGADGLADKLGFVDPAFRPAYHQFVSTLLSIGHIQVFGTDVTRPAWVPYMPFYAPWGSPNADDIYRCTPADAAGTYRLTGRRGTSLFSMITLKTNGAHLGRKSSGKTLDEFDLNELPVDADGRYSILLSAARPAGYEGAWRALHPDTTQLMYRTRTKTAAEADATCQIERLDRPPAPVAPSPAELDRKMAAVVGYATDQINFLIGYQDSIRKRGGGTGFIFDDQTAYGALVQQRYLLHVFNITPDEALILESEVPKSFRYWSVQVFDPMFSAIDNYSYQTSINDAEARIDADGKVRIVVANADPGVPNWLSPGGWPSAGLQWRWNNADVYRQPQVRKVKLKDLRASLPRTTPTISAEARRALHARHTERYQSRGV